MKTEPTAAELYLDLIKKCLTRSIFPETYKPVHRPPLTIKHWHWFAYPSIAAFLEKRGYWLFRKANVDPGRREEGRDWPAEAETMIGLKRLDNLHSCIREVLQENVPGDFIETGVWRGGACIFMRATLQAYHDNVRRVWAADSFAGLPKPDGRYLQDQGDRHYKKKDQLGVSLDQVKANFARYDLLDERVCFLPGWFKDTLPSAPIEHLAILRLDGDMYSSTMDALQCLYPKLSPGGFVIVDDYGVLESCRTAVEDFRVSNGITTPVTAIDQSGVYWKKAS
ncbi:MAG TPA: TylF/MycF family methyltransferase [Verrucomicrobiae bacterium]|nr:TylF/MycF family methyltransferase [Verrucomicrobiae bacterium]